MAISRRKAIGIVIGSGAAILGTGAWINGELNPRTPLSYDLPPGGALPATAECDEDPTPPVTEGPFYTPNTPERTNLRERDIAGAPLVIEGRVLTTDCRPVAGAVLDFWSCDGNGIYDNEGFRLRGHQFTDRNGVFRLETVKPAAYRQYGVQRTPHIHVKAQGRGTRLLTTQLFFPNEPLNANDWFVKESLVMNVTKAEGVLLAKFDFVL
jgi:protocatechuate 3,4-dioxygenase beta subunit